jgi:hypothetical protein
MWHYYLIGYLFSLSGGLLFVRLIVNTMWRELGWKGKPSEDVIRPYAWHAQAIGILESVLYTTAWIVSAPQFIAVWLALKVAGKWGRWEKDEGKIPGRSIYNIFLIGSGFSVAYSTVGAKIIDFSLSGKYYEAWAMPIVLVLGTIVFWLWARHCAKAK